MSALIQFFSEDIDYRLDQEPVIHDWILQVIETEGFEAGVINIIFCNDTYLLELNQRFLERDTLTDVIAFDYREKDSEVSGDVFISHDRTMDNAIRFGQTPDKENHRVIIHGILHLCGYSDKTVEKKAAMTKKEDNYLSLLPL